MSVNSTTGTLNAALTVNLADVTIAGPNAASKERVVSLSFGNVNAPGGASGYVDIATTEGGVDFYGLGRNVEVAPGKPQILQEILVRQGTTLRFRASAANTVHIHAEWIEQTVTA